MPGVQSPVVSVDRNESGVVLTAVAYLPALLAMMTVGIVVPFIGQLTRELQASAAGLGFAIALFSMPTAVFATMGGSLMDRLGLRRCLIGAAALSAIASVVASRATSLVSLDAALLLSGVGYGGIAVGAPCVLLRSMSEGPRIRAMSFLSTYPPTGYSLGLLVAAAFVTAGDWRTALLVHAGLMGAAALMLARALPELGPAAPTAEPVSTAPRSSLRDVVSLLRDPAVLRLGIAVALPNALSYGTSLAAPTYLARAYDMSLAASSSAVAFAKIVAMAIGGIGVGYLMARKPRTTALFASMAAIGLVAQVLIFHPVGGIAVATGALILWIFAFGGMAGGAMALLPSVVRDPARSGAASGLVNQCISAASFAAPSTWLALTAAPQFIGLAAACLVTSVLALPKGRSARN